MIIHYEDGSKEEFPIRSWHETLKYGLGTETIPDTVQTGWRGPSEIDEQLIEQLIGKQGRSVHRQ
jgi:hypothetical protein